MILETSANVYQDSFLVAARQFGSGVDRRRMNDEIALRATELVKRHLIRIAPLHHKTAERLAATPTGYLTSIAELVQPFASNTSAKVLFPTRGLEIFARTLGPVTVTARNVKYLTIPATAEAYGRRARTFHDLKFIPFHNGTRALVRQRVGMVPGKRKALIKKIINDPIFWLKRSVALPMDRSLLPSDEELAAVASIAATNSLIEMANGWLENVEFQKKYPVFFGT